MLEDKTLDKVEQYGFKSGLQLQHKEKYATVERFLDAYFKELAGVVFRHYVADSRACDIDIQIAVTPKETRP